MVLSINYWLIPLDLHKSFVMSGMNGSDNKVAWENI